MPIKANHKNAAFLNDFARHPNRSHEHECQSGSAVLAMKLCRLCQNDSQTVQLRAVPFWRSLHGKPSPPDLAAHSIGNLIGGQGAFATVASIF